MSTGRCADPNRLDSLIHTLKSQNLSFINQSLLTFRALAEDVITFNEDLPADRRRELVLLYNLAVASYFHLPYVASRAQCLHGSDYVLYCAAVFAIYPRMRGTTESLFGIQSDLMIVLTIFISDNDRYPVEACACTCGLDRSQACATFPRIAWTYLFNEYILFRFTKTASSQPAARCCCPPHTANSLPTACWRFCLEKTPRRTANRSCPHLITLRP